jgi:Skp family chaperone for outer membrane proteins
LKEQLRMTLDELMISDRTIATLKAGEVEYQQLLKRLDEDLLAMEEELAAQKQAVDSLMEHNRNLETENSLIAEIKQKYSDDLGKSKLEAEYHRCECLRMQADNQTLTAEIKRLLQ